MKKLLFPVFFWDTGKYSQIIRKRNRNSNFGCQQVVMNVSMVPKLFLFLLLHERLVTSTIYNFVENKLKKLKIVDYLKNYDMNKKNQN